MRQTQRSREIRARSAAHAAPHRRRAPRKGGAGRVVGAVLLLLVVAAAIAAAVGWSVLNRPAVKVASGKPIEIEIAQGSSTAAIAQQLADAGIVDNALMFRIQSRLSASDGQLKAGVYDLETGMSYDAALAKLSKGPDIVYYDVPIPEGFTAKQIAARFAARAKIPEDEITALVTKGAEEYSDLYPYLKGAYDGSLEGFLFPATYRVKEGTSAHDVVLMMLAKFDEEMSGVDLTYAKAHGLDLADVVTIASILERETKLAREYPIVASVIYNRLAKPMRLQLDSTVFYGLPTGTTTIMKVDLSNGEPHNTYSHDGLPVGPISNPGLAALQGAAAPAETDYYYYVLTGKDGSQTFTHSYDDFLKAVAVYKKVFGK